MAKKTKIKIKKFTLDKDLTQILFSESVINALKEAAEKKVIPNINGIYDIDDWVAELHDRPSRPTYNVVSDSTEGRFKEATQGNIKKSLQKLKKTGKPSITGKG